jgi:hypothetical protein
MVAINRNIQQIKELHNQGKFTGHSTQLAKTCCHTSKAKRHAASFTLTFFILSNGGYKDTVPLLYYLKIVVQYAVDI